MYNGPERRFKRRLSTSQPVRVTVFTGKDSYSFGGRLVDASRQGLGIIVESAVDLGAVLEIRANGGVVYGVVLHCGPANGSGFRIGLAVEEGLSGEWLVPSEDAPAGVYLQAF
jgi:hypothetical protein